MAQDTAYTSFYLNQNGYAAFDATSMKQIINERLSQTKIFTDGVYEGSNITGFTDVFAYLCHVLMFYLNQTSSEGLITQASLYENINRIVKLINYKPIGYSTSTLTFEAKADASLQPNIYNIPRFTYLDIAGVNYCFTKDVSFTKLLENSSESLDSFSKNNILYQGTVIEYPLQTAMGEKFEIITLIPNNNKNNQQTSIYVDHFNFSVFVKDILTERWYEYTETDSLFLEDNTALKYSKRLNENGYYEFTFGNNINGKQLNNGDQIAIYYLKSDGSTGEVNAGDINSNTSLKFYNTTQFNSILDDISTVTYITTDDVIKLHFDNKNNSTPFVLPETVDEIRNNAPKVFTNTNLLKPESIKSFIKQNFRNVLADVSIVNNKSYVNGHVNYFQNSLGLTNANKDARVLFNQVNFSTACNFGNIYVYMVPAIGALNSDNTFAFVSTAQKQNIINKITDNTTMTSNIVAMDPVYMAFAIGAGFLSDDLINKENEYTSQTIDDIINETQIVITKYKNSRRNDELIKSEVDIAIKALFTNNTLGETISISNIVQYILGIDGVKSIQTLRNGVYINGLNFLYWNPVYNGIDLMSTSNDVSLQFFQFPYLYNRDSIYKNIIINVES